MKHERVEEHVCGSTPSLSTSSADLGVAFAKPTLFTVDLNPISKGAHAEVTDLPDE
jgi:hypothetical protein